MDGLETVLAAARAAADPTRLRILAALQQRALCVCELVALVDVGQPAVSRHLGILEAAGLIDRAREGRFVVHRLRETATAGLVRGLLADLRALCDADPRFCRAIAEADRERLSATTRADQPACQRARTPTRSRPKATRNGARA
ncbi:MAG: winged helix-turn-helix transcriptional regulator [Planctomycetes bacterium]|nr:winged helix-turn-helix transcriptional regulator [Planctomycetota bacterium]